MRRARGWLWVLGLAVAQPIAGGHAQEAPEAASGKAKEKRAKVAVDVAAQSPRPAKLEAADDTPKPGAPAQPAKPAGGAAAGAKPAKPAKPAKVVEPAERAVAHKAKGKRPSKAESELASAQPAPAPAPPPPAAAPTPVAPQPVAAAKPAGPNCALDEAEQPRGGRLDVVGSGFGQAPVVRIAQRPARMIERRTDRISVQVPADSDGGAVTLQSEGQRASCGNLVIIGKNR